MKFTSPNVGCASITDSSKARNPEVRGISPADSLDALVWNSERIAAAVDSSVCGVRALSTMLCFYEPLALYGESLERGGWKDEFERASERYALAVGFPPKVRSEVRAEIDRRLGR